MPFHFPKSVPRNQSAQASLRQEITAVPEVDGAGEPFNERDVKRGQARRLVPWPLEIDEDDPAAGPEQPVRFGEKTGPHLRRLIVKGEGNDDALEDRRQKRRPRGIRTNERNTFMAAGRIFHHPEADIQPAGDPPLPGQPTDLGARAATKVEDGKKIVLDDDVPNFLPEPVEERLENAVIDQARGVP